MGASPPWISVMGASSPWISVMGARPWIRKKSNGMV